MSDYHSLVTRKNRRENVKTMVRLFILIAALSLSSPFWALVWALEDDSGNPTPQGVVAGIDYLIDFVKPTSSNNIDVSRLDDLIDFVHSSKPGDIKVQLPPRMKAAAAYHQFEIQRNLKDILQLAYHPAHGLK